MVVAVMARNGHGVLRVLVDMDGVLTDIGRHFLTCFREKFPELPFIPREERRNFFLLDDYKKFEESSPGILTKVRSVYESEGFFRTIPPIEGSLDAVKAMSQIDNVDVFLCTSPLTKTKGAHYDAKEKFDWIEEHLGQNWVPRVIITADKTMVHGDLLIDDKSCITGSMKPPSWKHILFSAHHNKHISLDKTTAVVRLENWIDVKWLDIIQEYRQKIE